MSRQPGDMRSRQPDRSNGNNPPTGPDRSWRWVLMALAAVVLVAFLVSNLMSATQAPTVKYSQFVNELQHGLVKQRRGQQQQRGHPVHGHQRRPVPDPRAGRRRRHGHHRGGHAAEVPGQQGGPVLQLSGQLLVHKPAPDLDPDRRGRPGLRVDGPPGAGPDGRDHVHRAEPGQGLHHRTAPDDVRRRGRVRGRKDGDPGSGGLPALLGPVQGDRGQDPQGRAPGRPAGHGQDPSGPRRGGRSRGAVHVGHRLGLHGDVRRGRGLPGARPLPERPQAGAGHHFRRRDRLHRAQAGGRAGRRPRRAGADPQPDAGRDGRLRGHRGDRHDGGHQPARHPGPGPAAARPLRPPDRRPPPRPGRAPAHLEGALQGQAHRPRRRPHGGGPGHAGYERRRPGQPRQRVGAARRPAERRRPSPWPTSMPPATGC